MDEFVRGDLREAKVLGGIADMGRIVYIPQLSLL
jgi:hypothetical protein